MIRRGLLSCFIVIAFLNNLLPADNISISVIKQTPTSLTIKASFPKPNTIKNEKNHFGDTKSYFNIQGAALLQQEGFPVIPVITKMFSLPGDKVEFSIIDIVKKRKYIKNYLIHSVKNNKDDANSLRKPVVNQKDFVEITFQGLFRETPLFNLNIFPVKVDLNNSYADYLENITIEIKLSSSPQLSNAQYKQKNRFGREKSLFNNLFLNGNNVNYESVKSVDVNLNKSISLNSQSVSQKYKPGRFKILLNESGIYKITYSDLINANVPVSQFDTRKLRITNKGQEIPIYFHGGGDGNFNSGDYFEFWGEKNKSPFIDDYPDVYTDPFSDINLYWLEISESNGLRMVEESGALLVTNPADMYPQLSFTETIHFEEDKYYEHFGKNGANRNNPGYMLDHWFFDNGISAITNTEYEAFIPYPFEQGSNVFVKVVMRGKSYKSALNPLESHDVFITLNDNGVVGGSGVWKDQDMHVISNTIGISQGEIFHGENNLKLSMYQGGVADRVLLNWFDITYQRKYRSYNDFIKFKKYENTPAGRTPQFEVDGFSNPNIEVYKLGISKIVNGQIVYATAQDQFTSYRITFQDDIFYPEIEYVAVTPNAKKKPLQIVEDESWLPLSTDASLFDVNNSAEYIIITDELFYDNVLNLKIYREQSGIEVEVVKVEDIYDEFNYGIKSPLAIKEFLKYAYENWDESNQLLYVHLIGDASEDYKNNISSKIDYVPTILFETIDYGSAASDYQYSLISGDDLIPDLVISRTPVSKNSEFIAYYEKLQEYESADNMDEWRNKSLFISGNDKSTYEYYSGLPVFRAQNQRSIDLCMPEGYFTRKLNTVEDTSYANDPNYGSTTDLINYWDEGLSLINFYGHGGGGIWADVQLLNLNDIDRLNNGPRFPFICSLTCFTGSFESRSREGLMKKILTTPGKGAIGGVAASGVGWLYNDFALGWNLNNFLVQQDLTVGEAVLFAKIFYSNNNLYVTDNYDTNIPSYGSLKHSMVNHYNLFGDPYVSLRIPEKTLNVSVDNSLPTVGENIDVTIKAPFTSGTGRVELTNEKHESLSESFFNIVNFESEVVFQIPEELQNQYLFVKAYAKDDVQESRGFARLAVGKSLLDSVVTYPINPKVGDSITFFVYLKSEIGIESVRIYNSNYQTQPFSIQLIEITDTLWSNAEPLIASDFSSKLEFDIQIRDNNSISYLFRLNNIPIIDPRPDVEIVNDSYDFGGTTSVGLSLQVKNNTDTLLSHVDLSLYAGTFSPSDIPVITQYIDLNGQQDKNVFIDLDDSLLVYNKKFIAVLDAADNLTERDESNNIDSVRYSYNIFNIPHNIGTTLDGVNNDTIPLGNIGRFYLPPNSLSESSTFSFNIYEESDLLDSDNQPGFFYVNFYDQPDFNIVDLELNNKAATRLAPAYIEFTDTSDTKAVICRNISNLKRWVALDTTSKINKISIQSELLGKFALFNVEDITNPTIEITVNGRTLYDNIIIPKNPDLALILQDENGINLTDIVMLVDDVPIPEDDINIPDSTLNANAVSILSNPKLDVGSHTLSVNVKDANGNPGEKSVVFRVTEDFDVRVYGNYPNPFNDKTYISFLVGSDRPLDDLSVKIYTVSGRKIRTILQPDQDIFGYHEVEWDGRDDDGNLVANGVYFAILRTELGGESKEYTLKIARLR